MRKEEGLKIPRSLFIDMHTLLLLLSEKGVDGDIKELCARIERQLMDKHNAMAKRDAFGRAMFSESEEIRDAAGRQYAEIKAEQAKRTPEKASVATNEALRSMLEHKK